MAETTLDTRRLTWQVGSGTFGVPRPEAEIAAQRFVKGPLPLAWFHRAAALPGKALNVGLALWYVKGLCRKSTFPFRRSAPDTFGVSKDATYDALSNLEAAGLISVVRHRGRAPVVTVIDVGTSA